VICVAPREWILRKFKKVCGSLKALNHGKDKLLVDREVVRETIYRNRVHLDNDADKVTV